MNYLVVFGFDVFLPDPEVAATIIIIIIITTMMTIPTIIHVLYLSQKPTIVVTGDDVGDGEGDNVGIGTGPVAPDIQFVAKLILLKLNRSSIFVIRNYTLTNICRTIICANIRSF